MPYVNTLTGNRRENNSRHNPVNKHAPYTVWTRISTLHQLTRGGGKKCFIELWFTPCRCSWGWFNASWPVCLPAGHVLHLDKIYIWDTSCLQRGSNGTDTLSHLATFLLRVCGKTLSGTFLLLCYIAFSPSQSPRIPRFTPMLVGGTRCRFFATLSVRWSEGTVWQGLVSVEMRALSAVCVTGSHGKRRCPQRLSPSQLPPQGQSLSSHLPRWQGVAAATVTARPACLR